MFLGGLGMPGGLVPRRPPQELIPRPGGFPFLSRPYGCSFPLGRVFLTPVQNATGGVAIKSAATKHATAAGLVQGEYAGQFANLRALLYVFGPMFATSLYQQLDAHSLPTCLAFYTMAFLGFVCPALLHASWTSQQMEPPPKDTNKK